MRGSSGVTPARAATFVASLLLLVWIAGFDPSPVHADDAAARMRIAAHDVHLAAYDNTLRHAITAVTSLSRRTPLTVLAFRRLANHTRVVENTALAGVCVVQILLGKLENPDAGELDRVIEDDRAGARRALKRADHALDRARPILARAARFGVKAQGLLGVPLADIFF